MPRVASIIAAVNLSVFVGAVCIAGEYRTTTDSFQGKSNTTYHPGERSRSNLVVVLSQYDADDATVQLTMGVGGAVINCLGFPVQIKKADDTVHEIPKEELMKYSEQLALMRSPGLCAGRVPAEWVKDRFAIRVTVLKRGFMGATLQNKEVIAELDTSDLDLTRIVVDKPSMQHD